MRQRRNKIELLSDKQRQQIIETFRNKIRAYHKEGNSPMLHKTIVLLLAFSNSLPPDKRLGVEGVLSILPSKLATEVENHLGAMLDELEGVKAWQTN